MIKINKKDSILDIIKKIVKEKKENTILNFPFGHPILYNYLSLKILKNKSNKTLTIITSDLTSRKIGKPLGIKYSIIKDKDFLEKIDYKQNLLKHNFTFGEYFIFIIKKYYKGFLDFIFFNKKINKINKYKKDYYNKSNLGFFLISLIIAILLFLFIFYFAVNKTYIYITPEIEIRTNAKNFIFKENIENVSLKGYKNIELKNISNITNIEKTFSATGIDPNSIKISKGEVVFINNFLKEIKLLPKTRLETKKGIIFETINWVIIPSATKDNFGKILPGKMKAEIEARHFDKNGGFIGSKGNIGKNIYLSLPGLEKEDRTKIFAITSKKIKGGTNNYQKIILESDIKNSKEILENELKNKSLKELKLKLNKENFINNTSFVILGVDNIIKYSNFNISNIKKIIPGTKTGNFKLKGEIIIQTYIYNKDSILNKLKNTIGKSILEGSEKILLIDKSSLRIANEIYRINNPINIKATVEINYLISYNFSNNRDSYIKKLKNIIRGLNKKDAISILLNNKKISNVDIEIRPFFIEKVSNIIDNIIFKIIEK